MIKKLPIVLFLISALLFVGCDISSTMISYDDGKSIWTKRYIIPDNFIEDTFYYNITDTNAEFHVKFVRKDLP